jgi:hypothetical protein
VNISRENQETVEIWYKKRKKMPFDFKSYTKNTTPAQEKESKQPPECVRNCFCVSNVTDEEKEKKISYKKKFIMVYCTVGIFFGLLWICAGYYLQNADVIKEFSDIKEMDQSC